MRSTRKAAGLAGAAAAIGVLFGAALAWACVPAGAPGSLQATPGRAQPGQQVILAGQAGGSTPVAIFLTPAANVPVAEIPVRRDDNGGPGYQFSATVTIPKSAPIGYTVLIAVQDGIRWQLPFTVLAPGDDPTGGPAGAGAKDSGSPLVPILLGALVVVLAGGGAVAVRRRRDTSRSGEDEKQPVPVG